MIRRREAVLIRAAPGLDRRILRGERPASAGSAMRMVVTCFVIEVAADAIQSATVRENRRSPHREHATDQNTGADQQHPPTKVDDRLQCGRG